jgi:hypothetical protein
VSADGAYASLENFETVADCGGNLFVQFKSNATGRNGSRPGEQRRRSLV